MIQLFLILYTDTTEIKNKADYLFTPGMEKEKVALKKIHVNFQTS